MEDLEAELLSVKEDSEALKAEKGVIEVDSSRHHGVDMPTEREYGGRM